MRGKRQEWPLVDGDVVEIPFFHGHESTIVENCNNRVPGLGLIVEIDEETGEGPEPTSFTGGP